MSRARAIAGAVAAVAGFALMGLELTAVRLLAPHFGDSAYVWTNVIGVILVALAAGAHLGGRLADRGLGYRGLGVVLLAAGVASALVPFLATPLGGWLLPQDLRLDSAFAALVRGSLVATILLFAPAALLLGCTSPVLVRIAAYAEGDAPRVGAASALVTACSTLGSLAGTFATTHLLVPGIGSRATIGLCAVLLAGSGVWLGSVTVRTAPLLLALVLPWLPLGSGSSLPADAPVTPAATKPNVPEQLSSTLTPEEDWLKKLRDLATAWFAAMTRLDDVNRDAKTTAQQKDMCRIDLRVARDAFEKEWGPKDQELTLLAQLDVLQAIFGNAFTYKSESGNGEYRDVTPAKEERAASYGVVIPGIYASDHALRAVLLLPGRDDERKRFVPAKDWFESTWKASELGKDTVFVIPRLDQKVAVAGDADDVVEDLDPEPDLTRESSEKEEETRNTAILRPMFQEMMRLNLDRERILIDAGKGACGYALRLATYFPNRFAGLILRHPVDPGKTRLDSLTGVPVLILVKRGAEGAERKAADQIAGILNGFQAGVCKVLEVSGEYPFTQSAHEIGEWANVVKRDLYRKKVVLVPNHHHPRFQSAYWVRILQSEMLGQVAEKDRPEVVAEADRVANRITVTTTGVAKLMLLLNDAVVDLSKDVTIVVNGNAQTSKVVRDLSFLIQSIWNYRDPAFLWVARHEVTVKK